MFLGFRKPLYSCTEGMCHSSTRPGTSYHVTEFYKASPVLVLQATNAEARRPGYEATSWVLDQTLIVSTSLHLQASLIPRLLVGG